MYPDFTIYWKETPAVRITFDEHMHPSFQKLTEQFLPAYLYGPNGDKEPNEKRLDLFFKDRCFPSTRQNCRALLERAGLTMYQPKLICRQTHGIVAHDKFWLKFDDDAPTLCYADLLEEMAREVRAG